MAPRIRARLGSDDWRVNVAGTSVTIDGVDGALDVRDAGDGHWRVTHGTSTHVGAAAFAGDVVWVTIDGELFKIEIDRGGDASRSPTRGRDNLSAPMPATVVRVAVTAGARVTRGDTLVVLEAMKMELAIKSPVDGVVTAVHCTEGQLVQPGVVLVDVE